MPIFSFLAYPEANMKEQLIQDISQMQYCEVKVSENEDVLIVLTDTPDEETNKELTNTIKELDSIQSLSMTFGHIDS
ncbi:MAG: chaperone NapD [Desulfobacula sp.]|nr:chaperone NapD [Desulfobacula sp.]